MDIVFLVKGRISVTTDKIVLYNGVNAKKAFNFLDTWREDAEIAIEIYQDGSLVQTISKNNVAKQ